MELSSLTPAKCKQCAPRKKLFAMGPPRRSARLVSVEEDGEDDKLQGDGNAGEGHGAGEGPVHELDGQGDGQGVEEDTEEGDCSADVCCNICKEQFEKRGNLNRHIQSLHTEKEGGWPCDKKSYCLEKFATKREVSIPNVPEIKALPELG